jgi:hypothetical protein
MQMHDDATQLAHAIGKPEAVGYRSLQFSFGRRCFVADFVVLTCGGHSSGTCHSYQNSQCHQIQKFHRVSPILSRSIRRICSHTIRPYISTFSINLHSCQAEFDVMRPMNKVTSPESMKIFFVHYTTIRLSAIVKITNRIFIPWLGFVVTEIKGRPHRL